ncbi:hypothetical protein SO802_008989 [Lithocarpus litseifolius]|uniref:Uncharacterized protein n=1 Tax=Lithocarpus litseifolius TaxID=425828 RepID=A0AAW2DCB9_9ROSI
MTPPSSADKDKEQSPAFTSLPPPVSRQNHYWVRREFRRLSPLVYRHHQMAGIAAGRFLL